MSLARVDGLILMCAFVLAFAALALLLPTATALEEDFYGIEGRPVALSVDVDPGAPVDAWWWDFEGDGCFTWRSTEGPNATHVYFEPGLYYPVLRATNDSATVKSWIFIALIDPENEPPRVVAGEESMVVFRGEMVAFTGTAIDDGEVVLYQWDFDGDGTFDHESASSASVTWTYSAIGTFHALLQAVDDQGAAGTATVVVEVRNQPPTVSAWNVESDVEEAILDVTASDPDGNVVSYEWDFGDGSDNMTTYWHTLSHEYPALGTYWVNVTVTDNDGATARTWFRVTRIAPWFRPQVTATVSDDSVLIGEEVTFDVLVSGGSSTEYTYQWDLGDGNTSDERGPSHTYGSPGTYLVQVDVIDSRDLSVPDQLRVTVTWTPNVPPVAVPSVEQWVRPGHNLRFSDESYDPDGTIVLWQWDFDGDGTYDHSNTTDGNHTHVYPEAGLYTAVLQVTDNRGEVAVATVNIKVDDEAPGEEPVDDSTGAAVCCGVTVVVLTVVAYWAVRRSMVTPRSDGGPPDGAQEGEEEKDQDPKDEDGGPGSPDD